MKRPKVNADTLEVNRLCRYASSAKLATHVVKHVLENRKERWWRVLGDEQISEAKDEHKRQALGRRFWRLAYAYEDLLAIRLLDSCNEGRCHAHAEWDTFSETDDVVTGGFLIYAWPNQEKLFIVVMSRVRNGLPEPYIIVTGYRHWPRVSEKAHIRRSLEKVWEKQRLMGWRVQAIHMEEKLDHE